MRQSLRAILLLLLGLLLSAESFAQEPGGLKKRLDVIVQVHKDAQRRYHEGYEAATTPEAKEAAVAGYIRDVDRNTGEVLDLVRANPTDPAVIEALRFVIDTARAGPSDHSYQAMDILLKDHVLNPEMGDLCARIFYFCEAPIAETLLRAVLEKNPSRDVQGWVCYSLAFYLKTEARMARRRQEKPSTDGSVNEPRKDRRRNFKELDPKALDREVETLLERIKAEFADVRIKSDPTNLDTRPLGVIAEGELFAMRNLVVGKLAPEIRGQDQSGQTFSSKDYRGKVVVLTFSGNWCGPCVAMYPAEREMVKNLKDKPFALLSVNTDENVETLKKAIDTGEITWRCWWDGGTDGPITTRWAVTAFPSIFVLDPSGVIRFKDVRGEDLKRAVTTLLDESRPATDAAR